MVTDGILFDLDGTLWDSCRAVAESWGKTLRLVYGAESSPSREEVRSIMGMTAEGISRTLFSHYGEKAQEICLRCIREENDYIARTGGDVYPGIKEMLEALCRRYPLFLVSNCQEGYIPCFLSSTGFAAFFRDWLCEGDSGQGKAENIQTLCEKYRLRAPVYVGDTQMDEQSARKAGCAFVHAAYGFGYADYPDAVVERPQDLVTLFERGESFND